MDNSHTVRWPGPWDHRLGALEVLLRAAPGGISEFDLIRQLQRRSDVPEVASGCLASPLSLYRTHFLLFHTLYRLGDRLAATGEDVAVHCLRIRVITRAPTAPGLVVADGLRGFYAERDNLEGMTETDVERLLGEFWRGLARDEVRAEALAVLGLSDPISDAEIKRTYRRLAMSHHPDRGGDEGRLREITAAARSLGL